MISFCRRDCRFFPGPTPPRDAPRRKSGLRSLLLVRRLLLLVQLSFPHVLLLRPLFQKPILEVGLLRHQRPDNRLFRPLGLLRLLLRFPIEDPLPGRRVFLGRGQRRRQLVGQILEARMEAVQDRRFRHFQSVRSGAGRSFRDSRGLPELRRRENADVAVCYGRFAPGGRRRLHGQGSRTFLSRQVRHLARFSSDFPRFRPCRRPGALPQRFSNGGPKIGRGRLRDGGELGKRMIIFFFLECTLVFIYRKNCEKFGFGYFVICCVSFLLCILLFSILLQSGHSCELKNIQYWWT